jgi:REP element-mobilizing transposase RayT
MQGAVSADHTHLLVPAPPLLSSAKPVRHVKGKSSRQLQEDFPLGLNSMALNQAVVRTGR